MKLIFAGTPSFAGNALSALHQAGHDIALVLTQPDRPAGRGMKPTSSNVAQVAQRLDLPLKKPATLKDPIIRAELKAAGADLAIVAAYGLLFPQEVLDIPKYGCVNIHGSLLPRWRGAAPIQRAIEVGDTETGITIMQMDAGLDTGAILLERKVAIETNETSTSLVEKLSLLGAVAIVDALATWPMLVPRPQAQDGATYAGKISKSEAQIDWTLPAPVIERRLRAFDPYPGGETRLGSHNLKVWRAQVVVGDVAGAAPGIVTRADRHMFTVQCGEHQLALTTVQRPGGKRMSAQEFLRGTAVTSGDRLS